ncbi:calcium-activated potassium channel subunit beta-3-like [Branchiostoma lanceolatum]|uniref:calcium-activated potassium channel subunit beta-3-like n=1 Tax=Branchiostoma lanceolatum TaxID=7740 RepID=UPI0034553D31
MPIHVRVLTPKERLVKLGISMLLSMAVIGAILLVVLGITVAQPAVVRMRTQQATCHVNGSHFVGDKPDRPSRFSCSCSLGRYDVCVSTYECLVISVTFLTGDGQQRTADLVDSEEDLGNECAIAPCSRDHELNDEVVERYQETWGRVGQTYPCWYDPGNPSGAARTHVKSSWSEVFHALFWPALVMVVFSVAFCFAYTRFTRYIESTLPTSASNNPWSRFQDEPEEPGDENQPQPSSRPKLVFENFA